LTVLRMKLVSSATVIVRWADAMTAKASSAHTIRRFAIEMFN
jgi:hypothetical protein